jgi:60 kDa SS-A/Ro ribonucleoprotein
MTKMNVWKRLFPRRTHEGSVAQKVSAKAELRRTVLTCLLWEDAFYEKGSGIAERMEKLVRENKSEAVAAVAREARDAMQLRHVPLFLVRELARRKGTGPLVAETLEQVIQRADELEREERASFGGSKTRTGARVHEV